MAAFSASDNNSPSSSSFSETINKRRRIGDRHKKTTNPSSNIAVVELEHFGLPLLSAATTSPANSLRLRPRRRYSIGRSRRRSDFLFADRRVGRRHCQILFDPCLRKIYLQEPRDRASLNGVFVNGVRIARRRAAELSAGDEVSLVCANRHCRSRGGGRVGFVIRGIVFEERQLLSSNGRRRLLDTKSQSQSQSQSQGTVSSRRGFKRVFASKVDDEFNFSPSDSKCEDLIFRASRLINQCKEILRSDSLSVQNEAIGKDNPLKLRFDCRHSSSDGAVKTKISAPGKKFYLNRLGFMGDDCSSGHGAESISLQELLHPVDSISQMFIATFTSDILWFYHPVRFPGICL